MIRWWTRRKTVEAKIEATLRDKDSELRQLIARIVRSVAKDVLQDVKEEVLAEFDRHAVEAIDVTKSTPDVPGLPGGAPIAPQGSASFTPQVGLWEWRAVQSPDGPLTDWKSVKEGDTFVTPWPDSAGNIRIDFREVLTV